MFSYKMNKPVPSPVFIRLLSLSRVSISPLFKLQKLIRLLYLNAYTRNLSWGSELCQRSCLLSAVTHPLPNGYNVPYMSIKNKPAVGHDIKLSNIKICSYAHKQARHYINLDCQCGNVYSYFLSEQVHVVKNLCNTLV